MSTFQTSFPASEPYRPLPICTCLARWRATQFLSQRLHYAAKHTCAATVSRHMCNQVTSAIHSVPPPTKAICTDKYNLAPNISCHRPPCYVHGCVAVHLCYPANTLIFQAARPVHARPYRMRPYDFLVTCARFCAVLPGPSNLRRPASTAVPAETGSFNAPSQRLRPLALPPATRCSPRAGGITPAPSPNPAAASAVKWPTLLHAQLASHGSDPWVGP